LNTTRSGRTLHSFESAQELVFAFEKILESDYQIQIAFDSRLMQLCLMVLELEDLYRNPHRSRPGFSMGRSAGCQNCV
jgi:hypothetical protein